MSESIVISPTDANPLSGGDLAAFVASVEASSVHGAADALGLTQSAVTKRLQALERRGGVALLERGRFGVRPTPAGRLLYPEAKQALSALHHAQDVLTEHRTLAGHALALAASHTIGEFLLPSWLAAFRREQPRTRAQVGIVNSPGVLRALREHEAQIGFVEGVDDLRGFGTMTVHRDTIVVVVASEQCWRRRRAISVRDLADEPYVTREAASGTRAVANDALSRAGTDLVPTTETASLQSVKRALVSGGFSLLSPLAVEAEVRAGTLLQVPLREVDLSRELRAVHDSRTRLSGLSQRFWTWLQNNPAAEVDATPAE